MRLYNSLTGHVEAFAPIHPGEVRMYVCGLTVSDDAHLGHGRAAAVFDLLRRVFRTRGLAVLYVRNITDVDDKILARAREKGEDPEALAATYLARYDEDMERLRVPRAEIEPKASEHIPEMIAFIRELEKKGATYMKEGGVYFRLGASLNYGHLARLHGQVPAGEDFLLWRPAKEGETGWDSPWGRGRPGWHIECSAMSLALLGETFDIHGGGADLLHPHHDAEIAQSEARTGKAPARFFLHNGLVYLEEEKMSKSLGNFFTLREIFARYDPAVVRYYLFRTHYRKPIAFDPEDLEPARIAVERIESFLRASAAVVGPAPAVPSPGAKELAETARAAHCEILSALEDDLDTPRALDALERVVAAGEAHLAGGAPDTNVLGKVEEMIDSVEEIFDIRPERARTGSRTAEVIEAVLETRKRLRAAPPEDAGSHRAAEALTESLADIGIEILDTPWGTRWRWE